MEMTDAHYKTPSPGYFPKPRAHTPLTSPETVDNMLSQENTPSPLLEAMLSKFF